MASRFRLPEAHSQHRRTIIKTGLYRVLMALITVIVAYVFTNDTGSAVKIGLGANIIKTVTYYGYERIWSRIDYGLD